MVKIFLYDNFLKIDPNNPKDPKRDRFILSKGHAGAALYAALAESGFFPTTKLSTHYQDGSDLSGHVSHKNIPGVELSTGSLGHGLSVGVGMAKAAMLDNKTHRIFVLLSDGECDEGSVWEAAMAAPKFRLNNFNIDSLQNILILKNVFHSFQKNYYALCVVTIYLLLQFSKI